MDIYINVYLNMEQEEDYINVRGTTVSSSEYRLGPRFLKV